jgi:hypothetical protein
MPATSYSKPLRAKADGVAGARLVLKTIVHEMRAEPASEFAAMAAPPQIADAPGF